MTGFGGVVSFDLGSADLAKKFVDEALNPVHRTQFGWGGKPGDTVCSCRSTHSPGNRIRKL